ncbi:MAG: IMS domain-containing protein [Cyanobacteriota bacterium]|nr:IMS domain-containing protein [Cyanobacteriota bacterium]
MDLPIDHFRLLGVHAATDAQAVLNALQQRLEKPPRDGFTEETLKAREELLRASADLLTDADRRREYENTITALAGAPDPLMPALEVPHSMETGGLLLLLEAGQGTDSFDLACRALQPPQAPALGSGREADLALLVGLSCRSASAELQQSRRFEQAAQTMERGLQLLQRMGQRPDLRQRIDSDLEQLAPFRVLDLLSRDLGATAERQQGLALLENLVRRRGGLEGEGDPGFSPEQFRLFFRQIRGFLTVQEQIDLFERWSETGSDAAERLLIHALTASGFVQRKPDRIAEARRRLDSGRHNNIEPVLAHLHLLLGEVDRARSPAAAADGLAELCSHCRDWLRHDVLPGYRDLEVDPDLDAYFSDRDVQFWVEREDRRSGRHYGPDTTEPAGVALAGSTIAQANTDLLAGFDLPPWPDLSLDSLGTTPLSGSTGLAPAPAEQDDDEDDDEAPLGWPQWPELPRISGRTLWIGASALVVSLTGVWALQRRQAVVPVAQPPAELLSPPNPAAQMAARSPGGGDLTSPVVTNGASATGPNGGSVGAPRGSAEGGLARGAGSQQTPSGLATPATSLPRPSTAGPGRPAAAPSATPAPSATAAPTGGQGTTTAPRGRPSLPLRSPNPDLDQLRELLEGWLTAKARVLAGMPMQRDLDDLARSAAIEVLMQERARNRQEGTTQHLKVAIRNLAIEDRSPSRIAVVATLLYSDEIRDAAGHVVDRTPEITLRNQYVFARDDGTWRFVANRPADN